MQVSVPYGKGRITHICVETSAKLSTLLRDGLSIDENTAQFLLKIGAVYTNFKRTTTDIDVFPQTVLRVHQNPLRFDIKHDWKARLIHEASDFIVVNKPQGLPTHATLDNSVENLHYQFQTHMNIPLFVTHRLDILTSGLIVLAKTRAFQKAFNSLLQKREIKKFYTAKTESFPEPGHYVHYMEPSDYSPKKISDLALAGWLKCELLALPDGRIQLLTGRTHQIRAQLAHMGFPIVGDPIYSKTVDQFELICMGLEFDCPLTQKQYSFSIDT